MEKTRQPRRATNTMTLVDWNGIDMFMSGNQTGEEWLHLVSNNKPQAVEEHEKALEKLGELRQAYMMAYGKDSYDLINPSTKYSTGYGGE